ncbi:substrate-binding domain-containing protein [Alistipes sp. OttesenSCG-928-B03]|nr:substrate-binding domain-containing protein [Alistipes sp. OttesenSCG-928-B03]
MSQKVRIKDIAKMAGVSAGTVDRILHNRGNVSADKKSKVEEVLRQVDYRPNIHISAISLKKKFSLAIVIPESGKGQYWAILEEGIMQAIKEYETVGIHTDLYYYDQYDLNSYSAVIDSLMASGSLPDAAIIGPTFHEETIRLAGWLDRHNRPYIYVDSMVEGTSPLTFFSPHQYKCGYLIAKLIHMITPPDSEFALLTPQRTGGSNANATSLRRLGFRDYCAENGMAGNVHDVQFSVTEIERNNTLIGDFFQKHPAVKGAVVLLSRGHIIADYFRKNDIRDVKLVCMDLPDENIEAIKSGEIDFVISQRPMQQGFFAVTTIIERLIYGNKPVRENYMPLDIVTRENLPYHIKT